MIYTALKQLQPVIRSAYGILDKYSTEDWYEALEWLTDYYKDDDTLIAIDLKNEPHGKADVPSQMAKWDDSKDPNNWKYVAECAAEKSTGN